RLDRSVHRSDTGPGAGCRWSHGATRGVVPCRSLAAGSVARGRRPSGADIQPEPGAGEPGGVRQGVGTAPAIADRNPDRVFAWRIDSTGPDSAAVDVFVGLDDDVAGAVQRVARRYRGDRLDGGRRLVVVRKGDRRVDGNVTR